ncbi:glycosyl hydrolase family 79 C-terminal domain-containing protein [Actinoplanes sp. NPDC051411]|uniref:glycosyl hydrolase family 79 C-terminal domain-containing protein n=1 Tax=Actinoplanes sp. NPDC051411 TaxID=3155522 RepID=UPI00344194B6
MYKRAAALVAAGALVLTSGAQAYAGPAKLAETPTADPGNATISIDAAHPGSRLAGDAVGLSFEERELGIGNLDASKGNMVQLFRTLGASNVRIGGNTLDRDSLWVPAGQQPPNPKPDWVQDIVTPNDVKRLRGFLDATGWKAEVGVNVGRWDPALGRDQARSLQKILGPKLNAVECGNEPDQWPGKGLAPADFDYTQYHARWAACADVVGSSRIAGPDTAGTSSSWAASLAADEGKRMNMLTVHQYASGPDITIDKMLAPGQITSQLSSVSANLAAAGKAGLPMRVDEANSAYSGGIDGVSNVYASALWVIDYGLSMAQAGLQGVNIHGGLGVCNDPIWNGKFQRYTPICASNTAYELAQVYQVMPIYYGIWMARQMGPGRFLPVTVSSGTNISAYAVRGDDGRTRIALVQKDATTNAPVHVSLSVGKAGGTARVLHMTGDALNGTATTIQGATVDPSGRLTPGRPDTARVTKGTLELDVPSGSATIVTF